ncbi:hypothetical protein ACFSX5_06460 [Devosia albogilva]|jgi:hypothetical protein|uniref:Uncharacterized protein n=1 Tax=Devosia albogilva TaxID=429726 RepID=A0ABW5QJA8_9HYPH
MMLFAFAVDALIYAALAAGFVWFGRRRLPEPWNKPAFTIPLVVGIGLMLSLVTFPHWLFWPR